jgi:hypothetical protein
LISILIFNFIVILYDCDKIVFVCIAFEGRGLVPDNGKISNHCESLGAQQQTMSSLSFREGSGLYRILHYDDTSLTPGKR